MPDTLTELYQRIASLEQRVSAQERAAKASGWQLESIFNAHRFGGGSLMWYFNGHTRQVGGSSDAAPRWTQNGINFSNYACTTYGGPYITLDGAAEYLSRTDDPTWTESGSEELLVWGWCYATTYAGTATIAAKFDTTADWRSWRLWYQLGIADFTFSVSATGLAGSAVDADSTYGGPVIDTWYFVAGYFEPSTTLNIYVGASTDASLAVDKVVAAVPALAHDNDSDLTIGAQGNPSIYWPGRIGIVGARVNVPSVAIDDHVNMLFQMTKERYEE